ncbi:hypothetical protein HZQ67_07165 [Elizabethkingia anophelis]|uniref:hypothetical protein n=1 Tax=Elizabethkingia anophelis TaxID=1117645 RepID=UPI000A5D9DA9|nr:hypothetical protein [Elizabethkingia anophelis]MCT3787143.1 hypothetical protein [Elizabethkingia anophelis]
MKSRITNPRHRVDITRYSKGEKSYTTRDESKQGSPTADFRKNPDGKGPVEIKIRLKK